MPGSVAETVYGRQGGGWAPKPARSGPVERRPIEDRWCRTCEANGERVKITEHPEPCWACGGHFHPAADAELCIIGAARMAAAKHVTGRPLADRERRALEMFPNPPKLMVGGYA